MPNPSPSDDPFASLNPAQRAAVEHGDGPAPAPPLLVIAGAGSGKTSTLAHRVARLVRDGADPQRILLLTFSRRAAASLERRAGAVLASALGQRGRTPPSLPWAGTFHAIGARLLREYAPQIGLSTSFTIHDRSDAEDLMALVRQELPIDTTQRRFPSAATCLAIYSRCVNAESALDDALVETFPWCAAASATLRTLFDRYVAAKQAQHVLDYDDLLLYWATMMEVPALAQAVGERFDHVLVDEYQDTNRLQARILSRLKPDGRGVTVVGDDAQAIYGFRAATVRNILDFPSQYTPPARIVTLDRNYRSTQPILDAANAVIALASERFAKELASERGGGERPLLVGVRDEADQARYVAERVLEHRESGIRLSNQAVLFRSSNHSAELELELARRDIPFVKYGGLKFLEAAHVKDVLSLLRFATNPSSRLAGYRALRLVPGIGPATASRLLDAMAASASPWDAMSTFRVPAAARTETAALATILGTLHAGETTWPAELDPLIAWYVPQLRRLYDDAAPREADLAQLVHIASTHASRERFLTELTLDPPAAVSAEADAPMPDDDYLVLSTIHSAKGQEWKAVFVLSVVDGCIPSDMATGTTAELEEERRLLYVAMTRARDHLAMVVPQRFYVRQPTASADQHVHASRTRFIPPSLVRYFDRVSWPAPDALVASEPSAELPRVDLLAQLRGAWK